MSSIIFSHIEAVNLREGSTVYRVVTGAGIYDVALGSPVAKNLNNHDYITKLLVLAVSRSGRIVGMATRDRAHKCGRIDY